MMELKSEFLKLSKTLTAIVATLGFVWFFGEPFLEDYVESHFDAYDANHKKENSEKIKLRFLLSEKMGCDPDEVHIELGRMYQAEKVEREKIYKAIDKGFIFSKKRRNEFIREIRFIHPQTVLNYEN